MMKNLNKVKTVPYKNNYGYFFTSGPNTWHGMEKKEIKKERRCLQVNYVTFPTDWKVCKLSYTNMNSFYCRLLIINIFNIIYLM